MKKRIKILDIGFDRTTLCEASERIFSAIQNKGNVPFTVVTPNPIMVMTARKDKEFFSALSSTDLSLADGVGIISAAKRLGTPLPERVTGIDTAYSVLQKLSEIGGSVYLFGAKQGVAKKAGMVIGEHLPGLSIVGTHHGYFDSDKEIITNIKEKKPDLLIVCLGSPRQEIWAHENKKKLSGVGAVMCLGGALDVWAGNVKRAPTLFIKLRLEWLWRMICEPKRMKNLPLMFKFQCLTRKSRQKG